MEIAKKKIAFKNHPLALSPYMFLQKEDWLNLGTELYNLFHIRCSVEYIKATQHSSIL